MAPPRSLPPIGDLGDARHAAPPVAAHPRMARRFPHGTSPPSARGGCAGVSGRDSGARDYPELLHHLERVDLAPMFAESAILNPVNRRGRNVHLAVRCGNATHILDKAATCADSGNHQISLRDLVENLVRARCGFPEKPRKPSSSHPDPTEGWESEGGDGRHIPLRRGHPSQRSFQHQSPHRTCAPSPCCLRERPHVPTSAVIARWTQYAPVRPSNSASWALCTPTALRISPTSARGGLLLRTTIMRNICALV